MTLPGLKSGAVVVDASALVTLVLEPGSLGDAVSGAINGRAIFVPSLAEYEVTNVIRRFEASGRLSAAAAVDAYGRFRSIPLRVAGFAPLAPRLWELRHNATAFDGAYIALAEALGCELLTADRRLLAVSGLRCPVLAFDPTSR